MNITFHGAAGEVTGSKHLIETDAGSKVLLDCGLFQGRREEAAEKNDNFGFIAEEVDAVVLSHAHIDHSGLLPKLSKEGFKGKVYTSRGTQDLSTFMLLDSARIQQEDEKFVKKHNITNPLEKKVPLYDEDDVKKLLTKFQGVDYHKPFQVTKDVTGELYDAGHVLGSAVVNLTVQSNDGEKKITFTGDLGRKNMPILEDPDFVEKADYLIVESTYGDREHEDVDRIDDDFKNIIKKTAARGGKIYIPAFALERTQEIILRLEDLVHRKEIPNLPIYLDSPLAGKLTKVFEQHPEYYDEETKKRAQGDRKVFAFENLRIVETTEESKSLNDITSPCIIIAGSGMMENGRIRHHLIHGIGDHKNSILVVGYQAVETLGRKIAEGDKQVKIFGRNYQVKAEIFVFKSLSAHADMHDLDEYVKKIKGLKKIFIIHGEEDSRAAFAKRIEGFYDGVEVVLPEKGVKYEL